MQSIWLAIDLLKILAEAEFRIYGLKLAMILKTLNPIDIWYVCMFLKTDGIVLDMMPLSPILNHAV